jgi:hypothetical protein
MPENAVAGPDVAEIAAPSHARPRRAAQLPTVLRRSVRFDSARPTPAGARVHPAATPGLAGGEAP